MQWSLKNLVIATAVLPVAIFAIAKSTPLYVSAVATVAVIAWIAVAIVAWIDNGPRQAWARGVILAATAYGLLIVWMGTELELVGSKLATSGVLYHAHRLTISDQTQADPQVITFTSPGGGVFSTGTVDYSINSDRGFSGSGMTFSSLTILTNQPPMRSNFATIGHIYWGILFGLAGGWFAAWIARRQKQDANGTKTAS